MFCLLVFVLRFVDVLLVFVVIDCLWLVIFYLVLGCFVGVCFNLHCWFLSLSCVVDFILRLGVDFLLGFLIVLALSLRLLRLLVAWYLFGLFDFDTLFVGVT